MPTRPLPARTADVQPIRRAPKVEAYVLALSKVDRARIVSPGIPPRKFFFISLAVFAATWCLLGAWWVALREKQGDG